MFTKSDMNNLIMTYLLLISVANVIYSFQTNKGATDLFRLLAYPPSIYRPFFPQ